MSAYLEKDGNCNIEKHQMHHENVNDEEAARHPLKMVAAQGHCSVSNRKRENVEFRLRSSDISQGS
jgi:hypothetical protein